MSLSCVTKKEFILTWKIENSLLTVDACLESPTFLAENLLKTKWSLKLVVKIENGIHQLFSVLKRDDEDEGPTAVGIHFKTRLDNNYYPCDCIFSKGTSKSVILFPVMEFLKNYGQKGSCILWNIQCILWMWDDEPQPSAIRCIARTRTLITNFFSETKEFSWLTTKFMEDMVVNLESNSTDGSAFTLALEMNILVKNRVTIKIKSATTRNVFISGRISVKNDKENFLYSACDRFIFGNDVNVWEFPFEFSMEMTKKMLGSEWQKSNLFLLFEFFVPDGIENSDIEFSSHETVKEPVKVYVHSRFKSKSAESQTENFTYPKYVCSSDSVVQTENADYREISGEFVLKTKSQMKAGFRQCFKIPIPVPHFRAFLRLDAFKNNLFFLYNRRFFFILSLTVLCLSLAFGCYFKLNNSSEVQTQVFNSSIYVKSDKFNTIFQINITETEYDTQNISLGLDPVTLDNFLVFVFSKELESLQLTKVTNLLHVAYSYKIKNLKTKCTSFLVSRMSVFNVCKILLIANKYGDNDLKRSAKDFVCLHASEVFASNEWKDFMLSNSKLAAEMITYFSSFKKEK
ncbi:unnamed protein product [Larinioides sclopetarius]|uniref:BTB domain-containing protein n=1 Tax=Larinioides sclopetarius TaxID=280406 RepID=A0AAV2BQI3_9ARAC